MAKPRIPLSALPVEEQERRRAKTRAANQRYQARHPHRVRVTKYQRLPRAVLSEEAREHLRAQERATKVHRAQLSPEALERERESDRARYPRRKQLDPVTRARRNAQQLARKHAKLEEYREADAARHRHYRELDPATARAIVSRRRARLVQAPVNDFTAKEWRALCKATGYQCAYCKKKFPFKDLTQDHITPLSKGGSHTLSNILPACLSCNSRKRTGDVPCPVQPFLLL